MSNDDLFDKIKAEIIMWLESNKGRFSEERIGIEEVNNYNEGYSIILDFDNCMAEIDVNQPDFAPYRYVALEVAAIVDDATQIVYSWYDNESAEIEEIILQLNKGINFAANY